MLRRLVTGLGVALAVFGGVIAVPGVAAASADVVAREASAQATWVYVRWFSGTGDISKLVCAATAHRNYPGRPYQCRVSGNTTQLWVQY